MTGILAISGFNPVWAGNSAQETYQIQQAISRIDSLMAIPELDEALSAALDLHGEPAVHKRFGWQIESRVGLIYLRLGHPAESLPYLEKAIGLAPHNPQNHRNLGAALMEMGRKGRALSEYAQAVELAPADGQLRLEYGQLLLQFGDYPQAEAHLEVARRICCLDRSDCPEIQKPLAQLYLETNRFDQAAAILDPLYEDAPQDSQFRRTLIQAWQGAGRDSLLLHLIAPEVGPELPRDEAMILVGGEGRLGQSHWSESFAQVVDRPGEAEALVPRAVINDGDFWGQVSYNLLRVGKDRPALAAVNRAIQLDGDQVVYRNNRVVLLTRLGLHEEARLEWKKVLELDPTLGEKSKK